MMDRVLGGSQCESIKPALELHMAHALNSIQELPFNHSTVPLNVFSMHSYAIIMEYQGR